MGTLVGDLIFGNQSRTDRKQITDLYNVLGPEANNATATGESATGDALSYFKGLTSGNQQATAQAVSPVTNAVSAQKETQNRELSSEGTARGGGTNAVTQQTGDAASKAAIDAIGAAAPAAASQEASIGGAETGRGLQAASEQGSLATEARSTDLAHQGAEGDALSKAIAAFLPTPGATSPIPTIGTDINQPLTNAAGVAGTLPGVPQPTLPPSWYS